MRLLTIPSLRHSLKSPRRDKDTLARFTSSTVMELTALGQIKMSALILQHVLPIALVHANALPYLPVKLRVALDPGAKDVLTFTATQESTKNENEFGMLESKAVAHLHPLLVSGAIQLEGMLELNHPDVRPSGTFLNHIVLTLSKTTIVVLVLTTTDKASEVAATFQRQGLTLERPDPMWGGQISVLE